VTAAAETSAVDFDGIATDSATLPLAGTTRLLGEGGPFGASDGTAAQLAGVWAFYRGFALTAGGVLEGNAISAVSLQFGLRWQPLSLARVGVDLAVNVGAKTIRLDPLSRTAGNMSARNEFRTPQASSGTVQCLCNNRAALAPRLRRSVP
jgi:hypothetical protein